MGVILITYKSWNDPPTSLPVKPCEDWCKRGFFYTQTPLFRLYLELGSIHTEPNQCCLEDFGKTWVRPLLITVTTGSITFLGLGIPINLYLPLLLAPSTQGICGTRYYLLNERPGWKRLIFLVGISHPPKRFKVQAVSRQDYILTLEHFAFMHLKWLFGKDSSLIKHDTFWVSMSTCASFRGNWLAFSLRDLKQMSKSMKPRQPFYGLFFSETTWSCITFPTPNFPGPKKK